ncbi:MAG: hypothetical protein U5K84_10425 [Alkalibacterium sp.]|nr:hypothetical protein [Alkalibacterium sp.]
MWGKSGCLVASPTWNCPFNRTYDEFKEEIDRADYPLIRQFHLEMDPVFDEPKTWLTQGQWKTATQENIQDFSSLGFFYARKLHEKLKVPVGIYHTAVGGTPIEAWMREETLHELGNYDEELAYWKDPENVEKEIANDLKINQEWYADLYENDRGLLDQTQWMEETVDSKGWLVDGPSCDVQGYGSGRLFRRRLVPPDVRRDRKAA